MIKLFEFQFQSPLKNQTKPLIYSMLFIYCEWTKVYIIPWCRPTLPLIENVFK